MAYLKDERPETKMVDGEWQVGFYRYKAPMLMAEFVAGLKEKKLIGAMCKGCGKVIVPPRDVCGRCHRKMDERITVSNWGTITCFVVSPPVQKGKFTLLGMDPVVTGLIKEGEVIVPVFVRFDGSDSNVATILYEADPKDVYIGMRVQALWVKQPMGQLSDLEGVVPLGK